MSNVRPQNAAQELRKTAAQLRHRAEVLRAERTVTTVKAASALEALYRLDRYLSGGRR